MQKRFLLFGETISSMTDGQLHYISPHRLMQLYQLNPEECVFVEENSYEYISMMRGRRIADFICLRPRYKGDYLEHLAQQLREVRTNV